MKKYVFCLSVLFLVFLLPHHTARANAPGGAQVNVRVEGAAQSIASGTVTAHTFRGAVEMLAAAKGLTLTFSQSGADLLLVDVKDASGASEAAPGQWLGYVARKGQILPQNDDLTLMLEAGDEVVLYKGEPEKTTILTDFTCEQSEGKLLFFAGVSGTDWHVEDGVWTPESFVKPLEGVNVQVTLPGGESLTLVTDAEGRAEVTAEAAGAVVYYAEGGLQGEAPYLVRTAKHITPCGFNRAEVATRAQAAAFWVNMYGLEKDIDSEAAFSDITEETPLYVEIMAAEAKGLVIGYEDGTFRPDTPADLMQACVMAARLFPAAYEEGPDDTPLFEELPEWAREAVCGLYNTGLLEGIDMGWTEAITPETLTRLYVNVRDYTSDEPV